MKVNFSRFDCEDNKQIVKDLFDKYKRFLPDWVNVVTLYYKEEDGIHCSSSFRYRSFKIAFGPDFFVSLVGYRDDVVLHEICHCHSDYIIEYVSEVIIPKIKNEEIQDIMQEELTNRLEICNENLKCVVKRELK